MDSNKPSTTLEIVSDVVCPWCYIGKRRLNQALELLGPDVDLTVRWKPYELNPAMPAGGMDRENYYASKFGSAKHAEGLIANITANAHNDGLPMDYAKIKRVPNTLVAHRLIWFADQFINSNEAHDLVADQAKAAHRSGIQGVPAFVLNGRFLFSGAQSPETISLAIKRAIAKGL